MSIFDLFRKSGDSEDYDDYEEYEGLSESEAADIFASSGEDEDYDFGFDHDFLRSHYIEDDEDSIIDWYCDGCGAFLFTQYGKSHKKRYKCPECGYINDVTKDNIW